MNRLNTYRRGSVLMEFIVVFPIYLVLFGGAMMLGDMALHAIRLTSAERTECLASGRLSSDNLEWDEKGQRTNPATRQLDGSRCEHYPDATIACPFAVCTGVRVVETYRLPAWTRGHLATAYALFNARLSQPNSIDDGSLYRNGSSSAMRTREVNGGERASFAFHRCAYASDAKSKRYSWRSNARPTSDLCTMLDNSLPIWQRIGRSEGWLSGNAKSLNVSNRNGQPTSAPSLDQGDYARRLKQYGETSRD